VPQSHLGGLILRHSPTVATPSVKADRRVPIYEE
jgi:hypothetical protein